MPAFLTRAALAGAVALLAGCTAVDPGAGFAQVAAGARERTGAEPRLLRSEADERAVRDTVRALLAQPLNQDAALRIALVNHPGLQASYWELGVAQADLAQAARLQNPGFGFKRTSGGGTVEIERSLTLNLAQALTLPLARRLESARFEAARLGVLAAIERHAADTRRAWVEAVAARQGLDYARRVNAAAEASAELTGRMARSGNASALDRAREQAFHAEAAAGVMRAEQQVVASRERLARLLGLWGKQTAFTLPAHLPALPAAPLDLADAERLALARRTDVQAARQAAASTAATLGLSRTTRFVNVLELGLERKNESGEPRAHGYEVALELPLFDWGGARVARAEALYMQSLRRVAETAVNARSEAREHYLAYRSAWDLARHYRDQILPLRKKISAEVLLRYNGMLASPFELLLDAREQAGAVHAAIEAQKEFWLQDAALQLALGGPAPSATINQQEEHAP